LCWLTAKRCLAISTGLGAAHCESGAWRKCLPAYQLFRDGEEVEGVLLYIDPNGDPHAVGVSDGGKMGNA
jgi:hypothetical protein